MVCDPHINEERNEFSMKFMFICTGNICRSAMGEALMKFYVENDEKLKDNIEVYSCGVFAEDGDMPTYNALEVMREYGVDMSKHRATNIRNSKIKDMDVILCATSSHKSTVTQMYPELKEKVYTIKEYAKYDETGNDISIKDPWGYDIEIYRHCAKELDKCICNILNNN